MIIPIWYLIVSLIVLLIGLVLNSREVAGEPYEFYTTLGFSLLWPVAIPLDLVRYLVNR